MQETTHLSASLFHTASTLSASLRSAPSPRGEGYIVAAAPRAYMGRCLKVVFKPPVTSHQSLIPAFKLQECGASRRMYITAKPPPHSSFKRGFQTQSRERTPRGLPLNPEPVKPYSSIPYTSIAFRFVCSATSSADTPLRRAISSATKRTLDGSFRFPRKGGGVR